MSADAKLPIWLGGTEIGALRREGVRSLDRWLRKAKKKNQPLKLEGFIENTNGHFSLAVNVPSETG